MKLNLNTGLSALPKIGAGTGPAPFVNTKSTDFDGVDDYINCGNVISSASAFSVSAWFYASANDQRTIVAMDNRDTTQRLFQIQLQTISGGYVSGNLLAYIWDNSAGAYLGRQTDLAITLNAWHHVLLSYDGSDVQAGLELFVDGSESTRTYSGGSFTSDDAVTADLLIGAYIDGAGSADRFYEGKIDEVSVFNSAKAIADLWDGTGAPTNLASESGLVFWSRQGDSAVFNADSQWEFPEQTKINNWSSHSFEFSTDDYIDIGLSKPSALNLPGDMSISAWIKLDTVAAGVMAIVGDLNAGATLSQFSFEVNRTAGKLAVLAGVTVVLNSTTSLVADTWYHVVVTRSGSTFNWDYNIYLNGSNDGSVHTTSDPDAQQGCAIGRYGNYSASAYFEGSIDSVSIWNAELTSANVTSIFASGVPNDVTDLGISGLQGYWRMGEGATFSTNWTIPDDSTNSNDGTSANMNEADNVNTAPDNENQGLSVGMVSGSVVEETP